MLTKNEFVHVIENMKEVDDFYDDFYEVTRKHGIGGMDSFDDMHCKMSSLLGDVLISMFDDTDHYLDWWLWDCEYGSDHADVCWVDEKTGEKKSVNLDTPEKLYDFLIENMCMKKKDRE